MTYADFHVLERYNESFLSAHIGLEPVVNLYTDDKKLLTPGKMQWTRSLKWLKSSGSQYKHELPSWKTYSILCWRVLSYVFWFKIDKSMRILLVSSECPDLAVTGGCKDSVRESKRGLNKFLGNKFQNGY